MQQIESVCIAELSE